VRTEGTFVLRYAFFDIFATRAPDAPDARRVLATAHSAPFQVYATKAFPGLQVRPRPAFLHPTRTHAPPGIDRAH
jgi:hypothetical protein